MLPAAAEMQVQIPQMSKVVAVFNVWSGTTGAGGGRGARRLLGTCRSSAQKNEAELQEIHACDG